MKILVTGSKGQLGNELHELAPGFPEYQFTFIDIDELDLTDEEKTDTFFHLHSFHGIIHCAAYTAVDKAEQEGNQANTLNADVPRHLAAIARSKKMWIIHISTDYVFDGIAYKPYTEEDQVNPLSVYGKSKFEGEVALLNSKVTGIILRTSWLYSSFSNNFVKTILQKARQGGDLRVVYDQVGTPTYARDLAHTILALIPDIKKMNKVELYHFSNEGVASWYDFAQAVVELSGVKCTIQPIETTEYPTPAIRPLYSVLNKGKIKKHFGIKIPYWRDSLKDCIEKIITSGTY
jgi:dTDP-4-dehydrorhamnose reductase